MNPNPVEAWAAPSIDTKTCKDCLGTKPARRLLLQRLEARIQRILQAVS